MQTVKAFDECLFLQTMTKVGKKITSYTHELYFFEPIILNFVQLLHNLKTPAQNFKSGEDEWTEICELQSI